MTLWGVSLCIFPLSAYPSIPPLTVTYHTTLSNMAVPFRTSLTSNQSVLLPFRQCPRHRCRLCHHFLRGLTVEYAHHSAKQAPSLPAPPAPPPNPPASSLMPPDIFILSTMSRDKICKHMHHPNITFPEVHRCDTPNESDKKVHWSDENLHRVPGCCSFKNSCRLLQCTCDRKYVSTGEHHMALGMYATIRKANHGKRIDCTVYHYLDNVHVHIGFGDTVALGGTQCCLVFVDHTTH